ncbi:MAG: isoprenylcysteine carboxylmethyltransferase family protein [Candidatus Aureabacteria bacterium]|nr:isoprenylcysteine carboxylmethyltransferase family protein [Candidatus Auribacterota bacterium]
MALREEFEKSGNWLFRWRSFLPLALIGLLLLGFKNYHYLFNSHRWDEYWEIFCLGVSFFGLGIRVVTIGATLRGTSGRNTASGQIAAELNTTGMYSIVRHPLYLGNFFIILGISLFMHLWWLTVIVILLFFLYYERILFAEEEFLRRKFGKVFVEWAARTPAFIPRFRNWRPASVPFSWKKVLRREYSGLFGIIVSFMLLEILGDWSITGRLELDRMWIIIFSVGLMLYLLLRTLKKKTLLLKDKN